MSILSQAALFSSLDKYDAGCGWLPGSATENIKEKPDYSHGMVHLEVRSREADSHLGHF